MSDDSTKIIDLAAYQEAKGLFAMDQACKGSTSFIQMYRDVLSANEELRKDKSNVGKRIKNQFQPKKARQNATVIRLSKKDN